MGVDDPGQDFLFIGGILFKASWNTGFLGLFVGHISILEIGSLDQIAFKQFTKVTKVYFWHFWRFSTFLCQKVAIYRP